MQNDLLLYRNFQKLTLELQKQLQQGIPLAEAARSLNMSIRSANYLLELALKKKKK